MKRVRYLGPDEVFNARNLPGFKGEDKIFYAPHARFDENGNRLDSSLAGKAVDVTNEQALELTTFGNPALPRQRFEEVTGAAASPSGLATPV